MALRTTVVHATDDDDPGPLSLAIPRWICIMSTMMAAKEMTSFAYQVCWHTDLFG